MSLTLSIVPPVSRRWVTVSVSGPPQARSSAGSRAGGTVWKVTGRSQRSMAVPPTDVVGDVVAGYGPPWVMAGATATPVGQPPKTTRPAKRDRRGGPGAAARPGGPPGARG